MAIHSLFPGFVKLLYTNDTRPHVQILPVNVSTHAPGIEPNFNQKGGDNDGMNNCIDSWMTVIRPIFNADTSFISAEYWNIAEVGDPPVFEFTTAIGLNGTAVQPNLGLTQAVISLRPAGGGILKLYFMEGVMTPDIADAYPFTNAAFQDIAEFLVGDTNWITARGGSFPLAPLRMTSKVNDALRKKYLLNS